MLRRNLHHLTLFSALILVGSSATRAQQAPKDSRSTTPADNSQTPQPAPQVVTVIHRLNGRKVLRLLRRSSSAETAVAAIDNGFASSPALHTSITAGLTLGDGRTVVAFLPRPEAEVEATETPATAAPPSAPQLEGTISSKPVVTERSPIFWRLEAPDLSIMPGNSQTLDATFVGLDGLTGLSLLQTKGAGLVSAREASGKDLQVGQRVTLLAPGPTKSRLVSGGTVLMRVERTGGELAAVTRSSSGKVMRITVKASELSPRIVGGIAVNASGETIGIVDSVEGDEAHVLSAATVHQAAERVLARQSSVPRPLLGVSGEALTDLSPSRLVAGGWTPGEAVTLIQSRRGMFLNRVLPGTPAALADLRPGDVLVRINDDDITGADEFSWILGEAPTGVPLRFSVIREKLQVGPKTLPRPSQVRAPMPPGQVILPEPFAVNIKLRAFISPEAFALAAGNDAFSFKLKDPWSARGMEALWLSQKAAAQFGARAGLLVIFVRPDGEAARSGMHIGDLIESINGIPLTRNTQPPVLTTKSGEPLMLIVARNGKRLSLNLQ
jgi:S1-C subfamily serine protease